MFLTFTFISYSQTEDFICGFRSADENNQFDISQFSNSVDPAVLYAKQPKVFNVFFWQVNKYSGQFGNGPNDTSNDITEEEALSAIAYLNIFFNQFNIFFKYRGLDQFNSPETVYLQEPNPNPYSNTCIDILDNQGNPIIDVNGFNTIDGSECQINQLRVYASNNGFMPNNYINIYIPYSTIGFGGAASYANPNLINKRSSFNSDGIIHEMGHALYLFHPHMNFIDLDNPNYTDCEHVTREPFMTDLITPNMDYNADIAGDFIIDTNAAPDFHREHYYELLGQVSEVDAAANYIEWKYINNAPDCNYLGSGRDCQGDLYQITPSDTKNIMSYTRAECKESFTIGQAIRMHEIVELWVTNYESRRGDLSDLYEPYKGEYYVAGPVSPNNPPLFQPGFKYKFVECEGDFPTPAEYGNVFTYDLNTVLLSIDNDETNYNTIVHPNHTAIQIKHGYGDFLETPQKCYDNWNLKPIGGSITKFNDDTFNTNVTITPQDSTAINNQDLIQNLDSGLYKIDKIYNDGSTEETVIIKDNN